MKQPETFEQCFEILDSELNDEQKLEIIKSPISVHHSVGRWIRNNFGFWTKTNLTLTEKLQLLTGSDHPDDWSHYLLTQYKQHLEFAKLDLNLYTWEKKEILKHPERTLRWFSDKVRFVFNLWGRTNKQISDLLNKYSDYLKSK